MNLTEKLSGHSCLISLAPGILFSNRNEGNNTDDLQLIVLNNTRQVNKSITLPPLKIQIGNFSLTQCTVHRYGATAIEVNFHTNQPLKFDIEIQMYSHRNTFTMLDNQ